MTRADPRPQVSDKASIATILIVDDDEDFRDVLRDMLDSAGYAVVEAPNGRDAKDVFREHQPDAIITDMLMPDMDGIEVVREMLKLRPDLPIIAMSGTPMVARMNILDAARTFGAIDALQKPFGRDELLRVLDSALRRHP